MPSYKLLVEKPVFSRSDYEYVVEEQSADKPRTLYIRGPYMMAEGVNKNKRVYSLEEMEPEVNRYVTEMVQTRRALGELNHPTSADVNPERACHLVTELKKDGNVFYGKSKVLSTPMGQILSCLINDGVTVGMSSRSLGQLEESAGGINKVKNMRLVAIDCVSDPSFPKAFINGILESRQYVLESDGTYCEIYDNLQKKVDKLPTKDVNNYLHNAIVDFLNKLKTK